MKMRTNELVRERILISSFSKINKKIIYMDQSTVPARNPQKQLTATHGRTAITLIEQPSNSWKIFLSRVTV